MARTGLILSLLVAGAFLALLFLDPDRLLLPQQEPDAGLRAPPDAYLEQVRSISYDRDGNLEEIREADRLDQFDRRNEALLVSPRYYSHNGNDKTWSAVARRGRYLPKRQELILIDDVVLTNDASGGTLRTRRMTIDLRRKTARSATPVEITQDLDRTLADGMFADLRTERVELEPNVESVYVNPTP